MDLARIKSYNQELQELKDKQSKVEAELAFNKGELDRLCAELTQELGVQVTADNVEQVCNERKQRIMETVQSGEAILARIKSGEVGDIQNSIIHSSGASSVSNEQRTDSFGFEEMDIAGSRPVTGTVDMGMQSSQYIQPVHQNTTTYASTNNTSTASIPTPQAVETVNLGDLMAQQGVDMQNRQGSQSQQVYKPEYGDVNSNDNSGILKNVPFDTDNIPQMFNMPTPKVDGI